MLMPRQAVPALSVPTLAHGTYTLNAPAPEKFTLVVFYRGLHCPICGRYLADLDRKLGEFAKRGVSVVVISSDEEARAAAMALRVPSRPVRGTIPMISEVAGFSTAIPSSAPASIHPPSIQFDCLRSRGVNSVAVLSPDVGCIAFEYF